MNNTEKKNIILDRISQIDIHIKIMNNNISQGYQNKDNMPSFEDIINDFVFEKQVLESELNALSNQDYVL